MVSDEYRMCEIDSGSGIQRSLETMYIVFIIDYVCWSTSVLLLLNLVEDCR